MCDEARIGYEKQSLKFNDVLTGVSQAQWMGSKVLLRLPKFSYFVNGAAPQRCKSSASVYYVYSSCSCSVL